MSGRDLQPLGEEGYFFEGPRWREGRWWVSDFQEKCVFSYATDGARRVEASLEDQPSGLGWMPDGSLLVVSMLDLKILRKWPNGVMRLHADLAKFCPIEGMLNDMLVDRQGRAYVGFDPSYQKYGFDYPEGRILSIAPDGAVRLEAEGLRFPNGMVITSDQSTLVAAETFNAQLTGYSISPDGALGRGEAWARLSPRKPVAALSGTPIPPDPARPDGICIDDQDHVWIADMAGWCLRIAPGGAIVDAVAAPEGKGCYACALGGPDGRTLLICTSTPPRPGQPRTKQARLMTTTVTVPAQAAD
jgi:sugar lactone lactonase YvrE